MTAPVKDPVPVVAPVIKDNGHPGQKAHYQAIRWDLRTKQYTFSKGLYTEEQWAKSENRRKWVRLATEFPAMWLPENPGQKS